MDDFRECRSARQVETGRPGGGAFWAHFWEFRQTGETKLVTKMASRAKA